METNRAAADRGGDKTTSTKEGTTLRRPDGHVTKRALEWNPQAKRKRGRPPHTWRRTRMSELEERGLTWREAKDTAENRVRWWALVEELCSIRNEEE